MPSSQAVWVMFSEPTELTERAGLPGSVPSSTGFKCRLEREQRERRPTHTSDQGPQPRSRKGSAVTMLCSQLPRTVQREQPDNPCPCFSDRRPQSGEWVGGYSLLFQSPLKVVWEGNSGTKHPACSPNQVVWGRGWEHCWFSPPRPVQEGNVQEFPYESVSLARENFQVGT